MNEYYIAGGLLLVVGLLGTGAGLIWWFVGLQRPAHIPGPVITIMERINWAALIIFLGYGTVWYLGNIEYGNNAALVMVLDAAEVANGTDTLQPWVKSWLFAFIVNFLPSSGQWWRWALKPKGKNLYTSYVISGIDWSLNIVGLYWLCAVSFAPQLFRSLDRRHSGIHTQFLVSRCSTGCGANFSSHLDFTARQTEKVIN